MAVRIRDPRGARGDVDAMLADISAGGARLTVATSAPPGGRVLLVCPRLAPDPVPGEVLECRDGQLRLRFLLEPAAEASLRHALDARLGNTDIPLAA